MAESEIVHMDLDEPQNSGGRVVSGLRPGGLRPLGPNHKPIMAWEDDSHEITYVHRSFGLSPNDHTFMLGEKGSATGDEGAGKTLARLMLNDDGTVSGVETHPKYRRQGLATKLYNFAKDIHEEIPTIPAPKHSESRTNLGQQWAKSVGDELPPLRTRVPEEDYRGAHWE